jgi:hypothetical protein
MTASQHLQIMEISQKHKQMRKKKQSGKIFHVIWLSDSGDRISPRTH